MRAVRVALKSLLVLVLLLGLIVSTAVFFLSTAAGRTFVAQNLDRALSSATGAEISIDLHALSANSLEASATVRQRGRLVARVEHLTLRIDTRGLIVSWWHDKPLVVVVQELHAEELELRLDSLLASSKRSAGPTKPLRLPGLVVDDLSVERLTLFGPKQLTLQGTLAGTLKAAERSQIGATVAFVGELSGQPLRLSAELDREELRGSATLAGRGAVARLAVEGNIGSERTLAFDGAFDVADWSRVRGVPQAPQGGSLRVRASGKADLRSLVVQGRLEANGRKLVWPGASVERVALRGRWQGPLKKTPTGQLAFELSGARVGPWQDPRGLAANGEVRLEAGRVRAEAEVSDRLGPIVRARAETALSALSRPSRAELLASIDMPDRLLSAIPLPVALPLSSDARLAASAKVLGTIAAPEVRLLARLRAQGGVVDVAATVHPARLAGASAKLDAVENVRVSVQRFPLQAVTVLQSVGVRGSLDGAAYAEGRSGGQGVARLQASALALQDKSIPNASLSLMLVNGRLAGFVHMGDPARFLEAQLGARLAPGEQSLERAQLKLDAKQFPITAVIPVKGGPIVLRGELDGGLDLDLSRQIEQSRVGGSLRFSRGVVSVPTFGPALQGVTADLRIRPEGVLELSNFTARGVSGRVHGEGQATFKGLSFESARFSVRGDEREGFALWVAGSQIGTVKGRVDVVAERQPSGTVELRYDAKNTELELPARRGMVRKAPEDPTIVIGIVTQEGRVVSLLPEEKRRTGPGRPSVRLEGTLHRVKVTRPGQLEFLVQGDPVLELGQPLDVRGELQLTEGWVNVLGKRFQIERGTIRFAGGGPQNAFINAFASWVADDGTRVRVGVQGKLGELKTTLQSEPARSENEIVQLITTGTTEQTTGLERQDPLATAVGTSAAARIVNDALAGVAPGVQTRVDTTNPLNPQPEFEVQASERVSVRFTTSLGETAEGTDRSTTTIDYRAAERWLVSTKVGNTGSTAVDVVWQFRY